MKIYDLASDQVILRMQEVIAKYHPLLKSAGVRIDVLTVTDDGGAHALMHNGYPAAGVVRVTSAKERAAGRGDAEIVIDRDTYLEMSEAERDALLDHELYHLEPMQDKHGCFEFDAHMRPQLGMRKHDHQFGWFDEIAQRHGAASGEVQQARRLAKQHGQTYLGLSFSTAK